MGQSYRAGRWQGSPASFVPLALPSSSAQAAVGGTAGGYSNNRATLWPAGGGVIDLHPPAMWQSHVLGIDGTQQVGSTTTFGDPFTHAAFWSGSVASWVDLHTPGVYHSIATAIHGGVQVGYGFPLGSSGTHALLWRGTSASVVDLHPGAAYPTSEAYGIWNNVQVGRAHFSACYWTGTAASHTSLHPAGHVESAAYAVHQGFQVGYARPTFQSRHRPAFWRGSAASFEELPLPAGINWADASARAVWIHDGMLYAVGYGDALLPEGSRPRALLWSRPLPAPVCYANCDASTTTPILNVADFTCFLQRFAAGESYANCDGSTTAPTLNVADFTCFLQAFAAGCP